MTVESQTRCGFIALMGAPNAGKSTLLNSIVGSKVAIVTPKPQTTRARVLGIAVMGNSQLVFIDTPGIFAPRRRLDRAMIAAAWSGAVSADIVLLLVDASKGATKDTRQIVAGLKERGAKAVLVLNKIDLVKRPKLLTLADELSREGIFTDTFMVSAATGDGVADLVDYLTERVPEGPWHFEKDQISDAPQFLLAAEITREQVILQLHQELPYAAAVETEAWTPHEDGSARIDQVIYVARDSQKPIVIGRNGARIKAIGTAARAELERLLGHPGHLFLHVKVRDWAEHPEHYKLLGLDYNV